MIAFPRVVEGDFADPWDAVGDFHYCIERLEARLEHIRTIYRSQFS